MKRTIEEYRAGRKERVMEQLRHDLLWMEANALADRLRVLHTAELVRYLQYQIAHDGRCRGFDDSRLLRLWRLRDRVAQRIRRRHR